MAFLLDLSTFSNRIFWNSPPFSLFCFKLELNCENNRIIEVCKVVKTLLLTFCYFIFVVVHHCD